MNFEGNMWIAVVNIIIWSGLFLYLLSIDKKITRQEKDTSSSPKSS